MAPGDLKFFVGKVYMNELNCYPKCRVLYVFCLSCVPPSQLYFSRKLFVEATCFYLPSLHMSSAMNSSLPLPTAMRISPCVTLDLLFLLYCGLSTSHLKALKLSN